MIQTAKGQLVRTIGSRNVETVKVLAHLIGVLTKPDRIPPGEEERWLNIIRNDEKPLENGWFCVKQPDSRALAEGITWEEARAKERDYFAFTAPWSSLDYSQQQQLGTANLTERLSSLLSGLITRR